MEKRSNDESDQETRAQQDTTSLVSTPMESQGNILKPGAYQVSPGVSRSERLLDEAVLNDEDRSTLLACSPTPLPHSVDVILVEANLVNERLDSRSVLAPVVNAEPLECRLPVYVGIGVMGVLLIAGIATSVPLGLAASRSRQMPSAPPPYTNPTETPSSFQTFASIPTSVSSVRSSSRPSHSPLPSTSPTFAPSTNVALQFLLTLPSTSIASIQMNLSSPQHLAFEWVVSSDQASIALPRRRQRFALATLFFASEGYGSWRQRSGWLNASVDECSWIGANCAAGGKIRAVVLPSNKLTGSNGIPPEIGLLSSLRFLDLSENKMLKGSVPSEVGLLTHLRRLNLYSCGFQGSIPTELGYLTNLEDLNLSDNRLIGTVPKELSELTNCSNLELWGNELSGTLPASLGTMGALTQLSVESNGLSGVIPTEFGLLTRLEKMLLSNNALRGPIPTYLGRLYNLQWLFLDTNSWARSIPTEFGQLSRLRNLNLLSSALTGSIPTELGWLFSLEVLDLSNNTLQGTIPTELGFLTQLYDKGLYLDSNELTGLVPSALGRLTRLTHCDLQDNRLIGATPPEVCQLIDQGLVLGLDCGEVACNCNRSCECFTGNSR